MKAPFNNRTRVTKGIHHTILRGRIFRDPAISMEALITGTAITIQQARRDVRELAGQGLIPRDIADRLAPTNSRGPMTNTAGHQRGAKVRAHNRRAGIEAVKAALLARRTKETK